MKDCLLIDCYDSFTHKLAQTLRQSGDINLQIIPWDKAEPGAVKSADCVVLSPGPGLPHEYPALFRILAHLHHKPVLGICMGHQIMALYGGARLSHLSHVMHGQQQNLIIRSDDPILSGFAEKKSALNIGLYHSWHVTDIPQQFKLLAETRDGVVMALRHRTYPWHSLQFHPESYMTTCGRQILANWIKRIVNDQAN
jgi:anthranilate synthase component 2